MIIAVENEPGSFITRGGRVCFIAINACAERRGWYTHMAPLPATWLQSPNSSKPKIKHRLPLGRIIHTYCTGLQLTSSIYVSASKIQLTELYSGKSPTVT